MNNVISNLFKNFLNFKRDVENRSPKTYRAYRQDLINSFLPFLVKRNRTNVSEITRQDVEDFLVFIIKRSKTGSVANRNRKLATIKSLLEFLQSRNISYDQTINDIKSSKGNTKTISYLTEEEQERLLTTVEKVATPVYKIRDLAIIKLFLGSGIRVSELTNLRLSDIELHTKGSSYIHIKRKGGNEAQLPINSKTAYAIKTYIAKRKNTDSVPYFFLSKNNNQMEANSIYYLVKHYLHDAGIEKKKHGPHILRHTVGVSLRRQGIDIATIQHLLGHKKLETTAIYLNVESQDLEKAVRLL